MPRDRQHPRRLGRHRSPVVHQTPDDVSRETFVEVPPVEEQVHQALVEAAVQSELEPPPLPKERIARLEALTAVWMREVRVGGPGPDDTLLYAAPKPPPPPSVEAGIRKAIDTSKELPQPPEPEPEAKPRRVTDWSSRHDERSRGFDVSDRIRARVPVQDRVWAIGPVFDQGTTPPLPLRDASGCVGMAVAAAGNALRLAAGSTEMLSKDDALGLYGVAQDRHDHIAGRAYAGTSVLAGMKAGVEAGLWSEYLWAFGTRDIAQALLQVGPVVIGIPWFDGMEAPDPAGVIRPTGRAAGGHAMCLVGIRSSLPGGPWFVAQQSRGTSVGEGGRVLIHHRDLSRLLAGVGEAAIPVPAGGVA